MKEILFRAWDEEHKKMIYFEVGSANSMCHKPEMQYICRKDKNNKKIFEGDIDKSKGIIKYYENLTWDGGCPHPGYYFDKAFDFGIESELSYHDNFEDVEIIGNIKENPELMDK